jgi:4-amino-4-deoxy-L-arabinose transferase-like glycosyltransferase
MSYEIPETRIGYPERRSEAVTSLETWLTVERAGYMAALVLALVLRLVGLDWQPLSGAEAAHALEALNAARALPFDMAGSSPLLFNLQRLGFMAFGAREVTARLWPAWLGGLSVLLFFAFRPRIGRGGALMAAFLWAISPLAVYVARLGLGAGLTPTLALATAAALETLWQRTRPDDRDADEGGRLYAVLAGAAFALLLASGPGAYTVIAGALLAALIWRDAARGLWRVVRPHLAPAALAFGLTLFLAATFASSAPSGLAAVLGLPGVWVQGLRPWAGEYGPLELLGRLTMSEILIVSLGVAGLFQAWRARDRFVWAMALFAGVALLAVLIGRDRRPADLALVIMPLAFVAGPVAARIVDAFAGTARELDPWLLLTTNMVLLLAAAFTLPGMFNPATGASWQRVFLVVGVATLALAFLQWFFYGAFWGNWRAVGRTLPFVLLLLGSFWTLSQTVGVNYERGAWRRPGMVHEITGAGYADLARPLRDLAALHGKGMNEIPVDLVLVPGRDDALAPVLLWLLRDFPVVRRSAAVPLAPAPIVIAATEDQPALADRYSGAEFGLLERWQPSLLPDAYARLRWVLYRQTSVPPEMRSVLMWVRAPQVIPAQPAAAPAIVPEAPVSGEAP